MSINKEDEIHFNCWNCGKSYSYEIYIERDNDSAYAEMYIENGKHIKFNNIDVDGKVLTINEKVRCKNCNCIIKLQCEYIFPYCEE